jgi:hypothetical protein
MSYIDELLESGGNFIVQRTEGGASFSPASEKESDLESFQSVVRRLRERDGDGFSVVREHVTSDYARDFVDLVLVTIGAPEPLRP